MKALRQEVLTITWRGFDTALFAALQPTRLERLGLELYECFKIGVWGSGLTIFISIKPESHSCVFCLPHCRLHEYTCGDMDVERDSAHESIEKLARIHPQSSTIPHAVYWEERDAGIILLFVEPSHHSNSPHATVCRSHV